MKSKILEILTVAFFVTAILLGFFEYSTLSFLSFIVGGCALSELPNEPKTVQWERMLERIKVSR